MFEVKNHKEFKTAFNFPSIMHYFHKFIIEMTHYPANIYLFKVSNKNTRKMCEIYSKLTIKTSERPQ